MLKSIQIKIVLAFAIVGIAVITTFGVISIYNLQELQNIALTNAGSAEISDAIGTQIYEMNLTTGIILAIFVMLMILAGIFVAKVIIAPISSLVKSAEQATKN